MKITALLLFSTAAFVYAEHYDDKYVAPVATGLGWEAAFKQASALVKQMTLEEKLNLTLWGNSVPRLGFPGYTSADGSNGPAGTFTNHSSFVSSITMAASMDRELMYERGRLTGEQLKQKGYNVLLGPMVNLMRAPEAGRNFEGYGPEPYLAGIAVGEFVKGSQDAGTITVTKHFVANEQEHARQSESSEVDARTLAEMYLWPFQDAVHAGSGGIMSSYNQLNGTYTSGNPALLGATLKGVFDFQGFVVTDFQAERYGAAGFRAGGDAQLGLSSRLDPPGTIQSTGGANLGQNLTAFVNNGSVPLYRVDDAAARILSPWFALKQNKVKYPSLPNDIVTDSKEATAHIRKAGAASAVLLKNTKNALPLKSSTPLALFGIDAGDDPNGPNKSGDGYQVSQTPLIVVPVPNTGAENNGTLASGFGSAFNLFPYLISPVTALRARAKGGFTYVRDPYTPGPILAAASQPNTACLVFASSSSGEEIDSNSGNIGDRLNITSWHGADELVKTVASRCSNTIVVVHSVGPILMDWADNNNVSAILFAGLPGQESGNSLGDVLYGDYNPSAKLPFSIAYSQGDYPVAVNQSITNFDGYHQRIPYTEGIFLDYRHLDQQGIKARYPFGHGLSYTTFAYSSIKVSKGKASLKNGDRAPGGYANLFQEAYSVSVSISNTGKVAGNAIPQLYIQHPASAGQPPKILRGFEKVMIKPGKSAKVTFSLRLKDISVWDTPSAGWKIPSGKIIAHVGESSEKMRAQVVLQSA